MPKVTWEGKECEVRIDRDLEMNWAVSVLSGEFDPVSLIKRPAAPVIIKVRAKSRWLALDTGLRQLKAWPSIRRSRSNFPDRQTENRLFIRPIRTTSNRALLRPGLRPSNRVS